MSNAPVTILDKSGADFLKNSGRPDWILSGDPHKRTDHWICQLIGHRFQAIATHIFCPRCGRIRPFRH